MLVKFCLIAAFSIAVIALTVSWKLHESIAIQSAKLAEDLTERSYETLQLPHQTFTLLMREDIRHSVRDLSRNPILIQKYEEGQLKATREELRKAALKDELDFVVLLNMKGQLDSSFPSDLNDFAVEDYIKKWDFGAHVHEQILGSVSEEQANIIDAFARHDPDALALLGLSEQGVSDKGALSIVAASLVTNDFSEVLGVCIIGKFLNHDTRSLENLNKLAGYASAIYLDTTPIALAGFDRGGDDGNELAFQINPELQDIVESHGVMNAKTSTRSGMRYLTSCSALKSINGQMLGMLCIGLPEARITEAQQVSLAHGETVQKTVQTWIFGIGAVSLIFFAITSLLISTNIVTPLKKLSLQAKKIAAGDIEQTITVRTDDEIGELSNSLQAVVQSYQDISTTSQAIAVGKLNRKVLPRSDRDSLGMALREMSNYLHDMSVLAEAFAHGDLRGTIELRSEEDVLGHALKIMTEGLRKVIAQIQGLVGQLSSTESTISSLAEHDARLARDAFKSVERMTSTMAGMEISVEDVAESMETLSSLVEQTSSAASQMTISIADIASNTSNLTHQAAQAVEFMKTTVNSLEGTVRNAENSRQLAQETSQNALEGRQAVEEIMLSMETTQKTMSTSTEAIEQFSQHSQEIGTILDVIRDITEQTSLLALNASIIAAQAGAHGRGFAVVADEIKNLARGVDDSTKDIALIVKSLQQETIRVVQTVHEGAADVEQGMTRTRQAQSALDKIINSAQHSSSEVEEIANALRELVAASHSVFSAMEQVNKMSDDITDATKGQKIGTDQIQQAIGHINTMSSQIRQATINQLEGVHEVLDSTRNVSGLIGKNLDRSQQISHITEELSLQAKQLLDSVKHFKLHDETHHEDFMSNSLSRMDV